MRNGFVVVFFLYFGLLSLLRFEVGWALLGLWGGGLIGVLMIYADKLVNIYLMKPNEPQSLALKHYIKKRQLKQALVALRFRNKEPDYLALQSVLFVALWIPVALYIITSSGSMAAYGLVLGIGLKLLYEIALDYHDPEKLKRWLFWQIKRPMSDNELKFVVGVFAVAFLLMSWLIGIG